jgi:hypothetical protein
MQVFDIPDSALIEVLYWGKLLYWTGDIIFGFNTGFYARDGRLIMRRKQVFMHYLQGWLIFDLFLVSVDWAMIFQRFASGNLSGFGGSTGAARAGKVARIIRILRLLRLMRLAKLRQLLYTLQGLIDSEWMTILFVVGKNLLTIVALNHYIACIWYLIGDEGRHGWVGRHNFKEEDWEVRYIMCLHWSLAQFTPGKSEIDPKTQAERVFATVVLVLAMVVATCFVSSITSALGQIWSMNRYAATQSFLLKKFLNQNRISRSLGSRVTRYIDGVLELRHQRVPVTKVDYLNLLSGPLNVELHKEMRFPQLSRHSLFYSFNFINPAMTAQLCASAVCTKLFARRDMVFKEGQDAECMYFVAVGALAYRYCTQSMAAHTFKTMKLESDQWCTEAVLWMPWVHRGQMRAIAHAEVTILDAEKFIEQTCQSEDVYKFSRGCAFLFWQNYDHEETHDIPTVMHEMEKRQDQLNPSRHFLKIQQAEEDELNFMRFD